MKTLKFIAVAIVAVMTMGSCASFRANASEAGKITLGSSNSSANQAGSAAGSALKSLYTSYKANGKKLDMSNATILLNLASLSSSITGLKGADKSYKMDFAKGMVLGSSNLVNTNNSSTIVDQLSNLANTAAASAINKAENSTTAQKVNAVTQNAETIGSAVTNILGIFKK